MRQHRPRRIALALSLLAALVLSARASAAARFALDDEGPPSRGAPLWFAIEGVVNRLGDGRRAYAGLVLVGLPLDRLGKRATLPSLRGATAIGDGPAPALKPPSSTKLPAAEAPSHAPTKLPEQRPDTTTELTIPIVVTPAVARAAVAAAARKAHLDDADARVDGIASRARTSALLPELRLRAMRRVEDGENLTPTEYDPLHTTASAGTALLFEGRATWRLDRLVFADEEVAIERIRQERAEARARLTARVLEALFSWQRALAKSDDPSLSPEEHLDAVLKVIEGEATLDVLTDGWFSKWRKAPPKASGEAGS